MPKRNRSQQFPYLTQYIHWAVDWRRGWTIGITPTTVATGGVVAAVVGFIAMSASGGVQSAGGGFFAGFVTFIGYMLGAWGVAAKRARVEPAQIRLRREARQIAERLEAILDKRRLHRDLSIEVSSVLEEGARNWHRAKAALESPYWRRADLPGHLRSAREQSLLAIDQGMQELLVLFATSIPTRPSRWAWTELVDEVVGQDFLTTKGRLDQISPFHDEARGVAEKLLEMADQVEVVSRRLAGEELISGAPKPGSALEATLAELRQLKEAEDELRQDLRG
ncbi:MAG: hypothetical protein P4L46_21890 [Fimbriimonas sp.]|nr:hypothetical protein [Fimbriimonas sp.]